MINHEKFGESFHDIPSQLTTMIICYLPNKSLSRMPHAAAPNGTSNLGKTVVGLMTSLPNLILHPSLPRCTKSRLSAGMPSWLSIAFKDAGISGWYSIPMCLITSMSTYSTVLILPTSVFFSTHGA